MKLFLRVVGLLVRTWTGIDVVEPEGSSLVDVLVIFLSRIHEVLVLLAGGELGRRRLLMDAGAAALLAFLHSHVHHLELVVWR